MPSFSRLLRHFLMTRERARRSFPQSVLRDIEQAVTDAEKTHGGEIRFVVEAELPTVDLWRDLSPRARAIQAFGELGVWDTEYNNGVLIYVLLADRDVEIVADRGFKGKVRDEEWTEVCHAIEVAYARGDFANGTVAGIAAASRLIARHYPVADRNELSNAPSML